jgi:hypothetical protein
MKTYAQKIIEANAELARLRAEIQSYVAKSDAGEDVTGQIDDLTIKAETCQAEITRLERIEKAMGQRAKPVDGDDDDEPAEIDPKTGTAKPLQRIAKAKSGDLLARMLIARGIASIKRESLVDVVAKLFPKTTPCWRLPSRRPMPPTRQRTAGPPSWSAPRRAA